ncbi:hypothetical protein [Dyadobacter sp. BHUBP1]|uniref:hypothetical protein n=1 Tax=Dyadobacter sp. BHUBP1 TaxID=3424178 RepID=UPI003D3564E8
MPLFNDYLPYSPQAYRPRNFNGNWWSNTQLALSGSNRDGSSNAWGKIANVGLPIGLEIVWDYFTGGTAPGLGVAAGNLANKGLNLWGDKILTGTDSQTSYRQVSAKEERDDALFSLLGNLVGSIAGNMGSPKQEPNNLDKLLGKDNYIDSTVLPQPNSNSDIKWLDDKKPTFASSLPYNMYSQFAKKGGISTPYVYYAFGGGVDRFGPYYTDGPTRVYTNDIAKSRSTSPPEAKPIEGPVSMPVTRPALNIKDRIALAEGSFHKANPYAEKNHIGPGHYGKYQLEPRLIARFAPGLSIEQFLTSPQAQEAAMDKLLGQYDAEIKNIRRRTGTGWDQDSLRLLTHFQGSPYAIRALKNPALLRKATKHNPSIMDYIQKRSFGIYAKGGISTPYLFFQAGSEVPASDQVPTNAISPADIIAIRSHYDLEQGETVSNANTEMIVLAGLRGELPVAASKFSGLPGGGYLAGFINQFSPVQLSDQGNYKVRGQGRAYVLTAASFDRGDFGLNRYHKGKRLQDGGPLGKTVTRRPTALPIVPFVYFQHGGSSNLPKTQSPGGGWAKKPAWSALR